MAPRHRHRTPRPKHRKHGKGRSRSRRKRHVGNVYKKQQANRENNNVPEPPRNDYKVVKSDDHAGEAQAQPALYVIKEEEPLFDDEVSPLNLNSQIASRGLTQGEQTLLARIKTDKLEPIEKLDELGIGVKRKRLNITKTERVNIEEQRPANDVDKCLRSCLEVTKLLISNLPMNFTQPDLVRRFARYSSLQCTYMVDDRDASGKAVLIFNDIADAKKVMKDYNGLLLDGSDAALKVELVSLMRRYEYGSPLKLIHYQVVKSPSLFKRTFNCSTIKR